jgi:uncharacterized membrane protein
MLFRGGYKNGISVFCIGFIACLSLSFFASPANAQVTELTGDDTQGLIAPGINIESGLPADNAGYRSRYGVYERALVKAVDQIGAQTENGAALRYNYTLQILSGEYKNKTFTVRQQEDAVKIRPHVGDTIMIFLQPGGSDTEPQIFLETYDRKNLYIAALAILVLLMLFFFGLRGLIFFTLLLLSVWIGIYTTIPLYLRGWNFLLVIFLSTVLLSSLCSLILIGWHKKTLLAASSTIIGTMLTAFIANIIAKSMHMHVSLNEMATFLLSNHPTINPNNLILIGFVFAAFAIIQDLSISIVCGMSELKKLKPEINSKQLFKAGLDIGREHSGTMILILAFAWIGGSISIFLYRYQIQTTWLYFLNQDSVANTLLLAIIGTIGIIASIPITSAISSLAYAKLPKPEEPTISKPSIFPSP